MGKFAGQVRSFGKKFEAGYRATARTAVQETISRAQRTRGEGGDMRVDTGFLRASIQAALHNMPSGPVTGGDHPGTTKTPIISQFAGTAVSAVLLRWDPLMQTSLFVGWTANYARHREAQDGFLQGAVEIWDQTVDNAARQVRAGLG